MKLRFNKRLINSIGIIILITALPATLYLVRSQQKLKQEAATTITACQKTFTDLSSTVQSAVFCLNQDTYCVVRGFPQPEVYMQLFLKIDPVACAVEKSMT